MTACMRSRGFSSLRNRPSQGGVFVSSRARLLHSTPALLEPGHRPVNAARRSASRRAWTPRFPISFAFSRVKGTPLLRTAVLIPGASMTQEE
jgi:hypothetical protein